jgi:uncharacterized protein (TIRG00374 family)
LTTPEAGARPGAGGVRRIVLGVLGIGVSVALLAWVLRDVSPAQLVREVRSARLLPLVAAVAIATSTFALRALRWRLLLRRDDGGALPIVPLWHAVAMGFMANNVLPFRAGELLRAYAASRLTGSRLTATFSSIAVERVFDGLAVVALLAAALFTVDLPAGATTESVKRAATTAGILCVLALLAACLVVFLPLWAERVIRRLVPSAALAERLVRLIQGLRHGLAVLGSPSRLAAVCLWSIGIWLVNAASFYAAFLAFDLPIGFSGALLLQGLLVFGIAVPSTPGYVGVFEAVIQAVLLLYGVSGSRGAAYALVYHMTTFVPITMLGLYSLLRTRIGLDEARKIRIA